MQEVVDCGVVLYVVLSLVALGRWKRWDLGGECEDGGRD
jgi:hypothetical protein